MEQQYPLLYKEDGSKFIQYNPIQELNQLMALLWDKDTSTVYQNAVGKTWQVLKKAIVLLLFVLCFTLALPIWLAGVGAQAGFHFYRWIDETDPSVEQIADRIIQVLAFPLKQIYAWASWFVKQYFNWEISFPTLSKPTSQPNSQSPSK